MGVWHENMNRNPAVARIAVIVATLLVLITFYTFSPESSATYRPIKLPSKDGNSQGLVAEAVVDRSRDKAEEVLSLDESEDDIDEQKAQHGDLKYESDAHKSAASIHESIKHSKHTLTDADLQDVFNATVGFQKIFMISLPSRSDRLDVFAMQARLTGMDWTLSPGVLGSEVPDKALPKGMNRNLGDGTIGCWRAHLNVYQTMVREGIHSALIFEDDADWDVGFKHQMLDVARGTRYITNQSDPHTNSPYGDNWDMLWIGHNRIREPWKGFQPERWVTPNDPTVVPPNERNEVEKADMFYWDDKHTNESQAYTRILFKPVWGEGNIGYALSLRGAMKMLLYQSMLPFGDAVDIGIGKMVNEPHLYSNWTVIAPYPKIVAESENAGRKGTDIPGHADKGELEWPESRRLMHSTRMNVENLILGNDTFESQYPVGPKVVTMKDMAKIKGHAEILIYDNTTETTVSGIVNDTRFVY